VFGACTVPDAIAMPPRLKSANIIDVLLTPRLAWCDGLIVLDRPRWGEEQNNVFLPIIYKKHPKKTTIRNIEAVTQALRTMVKKDKT
jgi:hypothetical protein